MVISIKIVFIKVMKRKILRNIIYRNGWRVFFAVIFCLFFLMKIFNSWEWGFILCLIQKFLFLACVV